MKKENSQPEGFYFALQEAEKYLERIFFFFFFLEGISLSLKPFSSLHYVSNQGEYWVYLTIVLRNIK